MMKFLKENGTIHRPSWSLFLHLRLVPVPLASGPFRVVIHFSEACGVLDDAQPGLLLTPATLGVVAVFIRGVSVEELEAEEAGARAALLPQDFV